MAQGNAAVYVPGWRQGLGLLTLFTMLLSTWGATRGVKNDAEEIECCPENSGKECNLPDCPSGQYCAWAGEEIGPPVCKPIPPLPACGPTVTAELVIKKLTDAGFKSGKSLKDPYDCTPKPCGDLPQLGPMTAMPEPQQQQDGSIVQRFLFASFKGSFQDGHLPDGRPWWRLENSLKTIVSDALGGDTTAAVEITSGEGEESGVEINATISAPPEGTCKVV
mmetsp:Transcript_14543/g.28656  ORF Transcript_14543/g.28656 Transcript_14543/m.28656 type:complete len:221 (-) Transcript_14543:34-696(-)